MRKYMPKRSTTPTGVDLLEEIRRQQAETNNPAMRAELLSMGVDILKRRQALAEQTKVSGAVR